MTANEFTKLCTDMQNGTTVKLEKAERFDAYSDGCLVVEGYHFSNTATLQENEKGVRPVFLYAKNKRNIVIDGNGSKVFIHGIMTPFLFDGCENITLKNFTFDYKTPTMCEFTVEKSLGNNEYLIRVAKDTLFDIVDGNLIWHGERNKKGEYYWQYHYCDDMMIAMQRNPVSEYTQMMGREEGRRFPCVPKFSSVEQIDEKLLKVRLEEENAFFPVGCTVQTRYTARQQIGGAFVNCKNVVCENLTIRAMHGLGILSQTCENVTFRGLEITPAEGRTIASNADFFQASGCSGTVTIENCVCAEGHDDFINVHGTHLRIVEAEDRVLKVRYMESHSRGFCSFFAGDEIECIDRNTLLPYAVGRIAKVDFINDTDFILELENPIEARLEDVVENATRTPALVVRNNRFGPSMGRGVLCTTRKKVLIENNVFYKVGGSVLCIEDDCNFWFESGYTTDVRFCNNRVIECGYSGMGVGETPVILVNPQVLEREKPVYVHKRIEVSDNEFVFMDEVPSIIDNELVIKKSNPTIEVKFTESFLFKNNKTNRAISIIPLSVGKIEE